MRCFKNGMKSTFIRIRKFNKLRFTTNFNYSIMYSFVWNSLILCLILCNIFEVLGQSSYEKDEATIVLYYFPNTQNSSERRALNLDNPSSFQAPDLTKGKRAKILVHGGNGQCWAPSPHESVKAYLRVKGSGKEDYNIFCLDYQKIAKYPHSGIPGNSQPTNREWYEYVVNIVGNKTARYILALEQYGIVPGTDKVHIIGHSLGGQVSGVTGRKVQEMVNFKRQVGRISGLDVMNLYTFVGYNNEVNLHNQIDSSDASFVDIIHTNDGQIGLKGDYGRVDLYPDGGEHQKLCLQNSPSENYNELMTGVCSHMIVANYWAYSIENPNVVFCKASSYQDYKTKKNASQCPEPIILGEYMSLSSFGKFYKDIM